MLEFLLQFYPLNSSPKLLCCLPNFSLLRCETLFVACVTLSRFPVPSSYLSPSVSPSSLPSPYVGGHGRACLYEHPRFVSSRWSPCACLCSRWDPHRKLTRLSRFMKSYVIVDSCQWLTDTLTPTPFSFTFLRIKPPTIRARA